MTIQLLIMPYRFLLPLCFVMAAAAGNGLGAQSEINFTVKFNFQQVTSVDPKILQTLERDVVRFLNSQIWTKDRFEPEERINATFIITVQENNTANNFSATMAIQSSRPVFGSSEETAVFNYLDNKIDFYYEQFQAIQLSENAFTGNLPAVLGFYVYLILGFDYDTFSPLGGQPLFEKAQEIFNRLPSNVSSEDNGWRTSNPKNRYWLLENIFSPRMVPLRRAYYGYHREGLDLLHRDLGLGRTNMTIAIEDVQKANQAYPNTQFVQAFVDAKREEIIEVYRGASPGEQNDVIQMLSRIDPANVNKYQAIRSRAAAPNNGRSR
ncbi:MAG: DUF4835 family protein [Lewinella sp.]|nr:DUF4835 family protein [Lewinella sp.]